MLFGQELDYSAGRRSGVVDQNIEASKGAVGLLDKSFRIGRLGQISRYGDDFAVCRARNLGRCCLERFLATRADCNIDTFASQGECDRLADTGAPSRNECGLPLAPTETSIDITDPRVNPDRNSATASSRFSMVHASVVPLIGPRWQHRALEWYEPNGLMA